MNILGGIIKMKYFISNPMRGKSDEAIEKERIAIEQIIAKEDPNYEIVDSFFKGEISNHSPVWLLGAAIQVMDQADVVVFGPGWDKARGCKLEHDVAFAYDKTIKVITEKAINEQ